MTEENGRQQNGGILEGRRGRGRRKTGLPA